eukprot:TRINITY_DN2836_c0_g1_i2.p1 TRINITY_DN2836_c0_g1~~TRINITY_DN2836_c0_g1_i2.p1  ORF type:complete len:315 (+),score=78.67 TRINITY_DN2836_c0_g1_i2:215-1159(+)
MGQYWLIVNLTRQAQCYTDFTKLMEGLYGQPGWESDSVVAFMHLLSDKSVVEGGDCWIGDICMYIGDYHEREGAIDWSEMNEWPSVYIPESKFKDYSNVFLVNANRKEYVAGAFYNMPGCRTSAQYTLAKALGYLMVDMTSQGKGGGDILNYNSEVFKLGLLSYARTGIGCGYRYGNRELEISFPPEYRAQLQDDARKTRIMGTWVDDLVMVVSNDHDRGDIPQIDEIVESWTDISLEVGYNMWWSGIVTDKVLGDKFKELDTKFDEMVIEKLALMLWIKEIKYEEESIFAELPFENHDMLKWTSVSLYKELHV